MPICLSLAHVSGHAKLYQRLETEKTLKRSAFCLRQNQNPVQHPPATNSALSLTRQQHSATELSNTCRLASSRHTMANNPCTREQHPGTAPGINHLGGRNT